MIKEIDFINTFQSSHALQKNPQNSKIVLIESVSIMLVTIEIETFLNVRIFEFSNFYSLI